MATSAGSALALAEPAVRERGEFAPQPILSGEVQLGHGNAFAVRHLGQHVAPGIDDEGVAMRGPAGRMGADLLPGHVAAPSHCAPTAWS